MVRKHKGDFCCVKRLLDSVVEYAHGLLLVSYWLHTHLSVEICTCWTGGGTVSIPQPVLWNSPQLPASSNCHFSCLGALDCIYTRAILRCYLWHLHSIQSRGCSGSQRPFIQDAPDHRSFDKTIGWKGPWWVIWSKSPGQAEPVAWDQVQTAFEYVQRERFHNISGKLVPVQLVPWMSKVDCASWMLQARNPNSTLVCRDQPVISNGNCHCRAVDKTEVLNFTLGDFVATETEVLFHKTFEFYFSEIVHPNILRRMLTDSLLKSCMYSDCHWCKHCHKKLLIGVNLRL